MNIKGMDRNMRCRGFQFEIGKEYKIETDKPLKLCTDTVFHYCKNIKDLSSYYSCETDNRFFEIEVLGEEVGDGEKYGSNHIKILREIKGQELDYMLGKINGNTGVFNSGDCNSGNRNSGNCNSGDCNSGDWNSGDCNSGITNSCDYSNGVFCSESDTNIRIFNKPSGISLQDFYNSCYWDAMCSVPFNLTEWIPYTKEEMESDYKKELIGGYLKKYTYKEAWANWWSKMTEENKKIIMSIPNFDKDIFRDITGIEI